jgi:hypothetical protein
MKTTIITLGLAALLIGCATPAQTQFATLSAATTTLQVAAATWESYANAKQSTLAAGSEERTKLHEDAIKFYQALHLADNAVLNAVQIAKTGQAPQPADVQESLSAIVAFLQVYVPTFKPTN